MNKSDTSLEARKVLIELWRKMPPEVKFRRVFEAYEFGKRMTFGAMSRRSHERE